MMAWTISIGWQNIQKLLAQEQANNTLWHKDAANVESTLAVSVISAMYHFVTVFWMEQDNMVVTASTIM